MAISRFLPTGKPASSFLAYFASAIAWGARRVCPRAPGGVALALCAMAAPSQGLIVFDSAGSTDNTFNTTAPGNGAPWGRVALQKRAVASVDYPDSSSVYLGNGYFLTANHTAEPFSKIELNGTEYVPDPDYPSVRITDTDTKVYRVLPDGETGFPPGGFLELALPTDVDTGQSATLIGYGVGKSAVVVGEGWTWPAGYALLTDAVANATRVKRWGTNTATQTQVDIHLGELLVTFFNQLGGNPNVAANEAAVTHGDSGSGMFREIGGIWKLVGIASSVEAPGSSFYNRGALGTADPDANFFVRTRSYAHNLRLPNWKAKFLGNANASDTEDSDHDGMDALLEYALGGDPTVPDTERLPVAGSEGENVTLTFYRRLTAVDLVYEVWESPDLVDWTKATPTYTPVDLTGMVRRVKASVPKGEGGAKFLQLRVTAL